MGKKKTPREMMFGTVADVVNSKTGDGWPIHQRWPTPTTEPPDDDELREMVFDSVCSATDGCDIEPDGICQHGHPSWLLFLGLI